MITYFFTFGILNLIRLVYQDLKNNRVIDDRYNYMMLGMAFSIVSHIHHGILWMLFVSTYVVVLEMFLIKNNVLGGGDISSLRWMHLGLGFIGLNYLVIFVILEISVYAITAIIRKFLLKTNEAQAFYPALLVLWLAMTGVHLLMTL